MVRIPGETEKVNVEVMHPALHALAEKVLNLVPTDAGRPITNIKPNIHFSNLERFIVDATDQMRTQQTEVPDRDGSWFSLHALPYRTMDNEIAGAVPVLVDIDAVKRGGVDLFPESERLYRVLPTPSAARLDVRAGSRCVPSRCDPRPARSSAGSATPPVSAITRRPSACWRKASTGAA